MKKIYPSQLPTLRRFALSLSGNQKIADSRVRSMLDRITQNSSEQATFTEAELFRELLAENQFAKLPKSYVAMLLHSIANFSEREISDIVGVPTDEVTKLLANGMTGLDLDVVARVAILEDEPLISMQISQLVSSLGHRVVGTYSSSQEAEALFDTDMGEIDLILADIQLTDGDYGISIAERASNAKGAAVIFVTAYPERLLARNRNEPTYLVTKPFQEHTLASAIQQAIFFNSLPTTAEKSEAKSQQIDTLSSLRMPKEKDSSLSVELKNGKLLKSKHRFEVQRLSDEALMQAFESLNEQKSIIEGALEGSNSAALILPLVRRLNLPPNPKDVDEGTIFRLGIDAVSLARMAEYAEELDLLTRGSLSALADTAKDIAKQSRNFRDFTAAAESSQISSETNEALKTVLGSAIDLREADIDDDVIEEAMRIKRDLETSPSDPIVQRNALNGTFNVLRGLGNYLKRFAGEVHDDARSKAVKAISSLFVGSLTYAALNTLSIAKPELFSTFLALCIYLNDNSKKSGS